MYGAIVELDPLSDTDRTGAKHQHFLLGFGFRRLIFTAKYGIIIRCGCLKFCGTGVYHLISCHNAVFITHIVNFFFCLSGKACNHIVRELDTFCLF